MSENNEVSYLKPQSPLMYKGDYVYPITLAEQIVLANGQRLEQNGRIVADMVKGISGEFITVSVLAENWTQQEDGRWTNFVEVEGVTAQTRGRYADISLSNATPDTYDDIEAAWLRISNIETSDNGIMFISFGNCPEIDLTVNIEVLM